MGLPILQEIVDQVKWNVRDTSFETAGVAPQGKITISGGLPIAGEYFTIHDQVFTFQAAARTATGQVQIGATADACVTNIATAINADLAALMSASASTATDTVTITCLYKGTAYNSIVFTEAATNLTMDGSGVLGGTRAGVDGDYIVKEINQGFLKTAGHHLIFLPELMQVDEIDTTVSQRYSALPSDFQKKIQRCYSTDHHRHITVYDSPALLLRHFNPIDTAGSVVAVAQWGANLLYQRIPSAAEELRLWYYKKPTLMSAIDDTPTGLPEHLAKDLLVNYATWRIFQSIYEGDNAQASGSIERYKGDYEMSLSELILWCGPEPKVPYEIPDELTLDYFL